MICCKVITNYSHLRDEYKFSEFLEEVSQSGEFLWSDGELLFSNTSDINFSEESLGDIIQKYYGTKYYIDVFGKDNLPKDDNFVSGWIYDKIVKINYQLCELHCQKSFRDISHGLDLLDKELARLKEAAPITEEASPDGKKIL